MVVDAILVGIDSGRERLCFSKKKDFAVRAVGVIAGQSNLNTGYLTTYRCQVVDRVQSEVDILAVVGSVPCVDVVREGKIYAAQGIPCCIECFSLQRVVAAAFGERNKSSSRAEHWSIVRQRIGIARKIMLIQTLEVL